MRRYLLIGLLALPWSTPAQTLIGAASALSAGCYQVTPNANSVSGAVWFPGPVDVSVSFEVRADVYLGNNDGGADGMAFVLRNPASLAIGSTPGGANQGFGGIAPSLIVEMDTYTNSMDPAWDPVGFPADHLAILSAGSPSHTAATSFAGPVAAVPPNANIEDGQYHELRITWDAASLVMEVHFDCLLRLSAVVDVPEVLGSSSAVYGFTASTGGLSNAHRVCDVAWNPFSPDVLPDDWAGCAGTEVTWSLPPGATNIAWAPAAGLSAVDAAEVTLTATTDATYTVTWEDACGVQHSDEVDVSIAVPEDVSVAFSLCPGEELALDPAVPGAAVEWANGATEAVLVVNAGGEYAAQVSLAGCVSSWTALVEEAPAYALDLGDGGVLCSGQTTTLSAEDATYLGPAPAFTWSNGASEAVQTDLGPGTYAVEVEAAGCTYTDEVAWVASPNAGVDLGPDVHLCWYDAWDWAPGYGAAETAWSGLGASGWVELGNAASWNWDGEEAAAWSALAVAVTVGECAAYDTVGVEAVPAYDPGLPESVHLCSGSSVVLAAAEGADAYLWSGGPATAQWEVDGAMEATLTAEVAGCSVAAAVAVIEDPVPPVDCGPDVFACAGTAVTLDAGVFVADAFAWTGPMGSASSPQIDAPVSGTYSVTVAVGPCSASDEIEVTIHPLPIFELGEDRLGCPGVPEVLVAANLPAGASLFWAHGPTEAEIEVAQTGAYAAFAEWNGCYHSDAVQVAFAEPLELDLASTYLKCPDDTLYFDVEQPEGVFPIAYAWSTGEELPQVHLAGDGVHSVSVSNACESREAAFTIELEACACALYVPTAFTPDNDGVNDAWRPAFNCEVQRYRLLVMNRWGEVVFATEDPHAHWWGQVAEGAADAEPFFAGNGLYQWQLELNYFERGQAQAATHTGLVQLVR